MKGEKKFCYSHRDMAFKYSDGQIYESIFHYWYVNGSKPKPDGIVEVIEKEVPVVGEGEGFRLVHPRRNVDGSPRRLGRRPGWCK